MSDLVRLSAMIQPHLDALGFAAVRIAWLRGDGDEPILQIMAERPDTRQLTIDDCAALSRRISHDFDAMEEAGNDPIPFAYRLEVSSPGIDRPLTRIADFTDWAGHEASVKLAEKIDGRKALRGDLIGVEDGLILLDDRKTGRAAFRLEQIESAKLVFTNRLLKATAPLDASGADEFDEDPLGDETEKEQD